MKTKIPKAQMRPVQIWLPESLWRDFRAEAMLQGKQAKDAAAEALQAYLDRKE